MLPGGYVPEHPSSALPPASSSTCTRHHSGGRGEAVILPTGHTFGVIPAWQKPGPNPPWHRANSSSTTDWHKATAACFQTHVGIGRMEKQPSRWYSRLQLYFIASLMAFPFSVHYYVTSLPYRNKRKHWNFYFIMETITSPNAINTIRGVEVTWQLVTAAIPDKDGARAQGTCRTSCKQKANLGLEWGSFVEKLNENYLMCSCHWGAELWVPWAAVLEFGCWQLLPHQGGRHCCTGWLSLPEDPSPSQESPSPTERSQLWACHVIQPGSKEMMPAPCGKHGGNCQEHLAQEWLPLTAASSP